MASRILGMGDVLTLIEKAGAEIDEEKAKKMTEKMKKAQFDFDDYLESMSQMKKMGGLLNPSRKHRIARGAGVDISEVNRMVKQFNEARKMMKKLPGMMGGKGGKKGKFRLPF